MEDYEFYHDEDFTEELILAQLHQDDDELYDLINERGKYAPTEDELYDRVGSMLANSYGEKAARRICASWAAKARQTTMFSA